MKASSFLNSIYALRNDEEMVLYTEKQNWSTKEDLEVIDFLELEYRNECLNYPYISPEFDAKAALWAAKIIYFSGFYVLFRKDEKNKMKVHLKPFGGKITPSSILSADLLLRFLPKIRHQLNSIDHTDEILPLIDDILTQNMYSALGLGFAVNKDYLELILGNDCLKQLFIDRAIFKKEASLISSERVLSAIEASLGDHGTLFWNQLSDLKGRDESTE